MECIVNGSPTPNVIWYKDGSPIDNSNDRINSNIIDSSVCQLEIKNLQSNDTGRYSCEATNDLGRVSTFARIQVVSDNRICEADNMLKTKLNEGSVRKHFRFIFFFREKL